MLACEGPAISSENPGQSTPIAACLAARVSPHRRQDPKLNTCTPQLDHHKLWHVSGSSYLKVSLGGCRMDLRALNADALILTICEILAYSLRWFHLFSLGLV